MAKKEIKLTKYEKARLIGARALQLAMGAPALVKLPKGVRNAIQLAFYEYEEGVIPLQVVRVKAVTAK
ncbi:DNA-directed RNA polymerase subunit K [Candidatus Micrarchaeota archaeon]|nr:DNA-directed RNA polymerase subunit K [Candidatus Micrarchaeota archaeon]